MLQYAARQFIPSIDRPSLSASRTSQSAAFRKYGTPAALAPHHRHRAPFHNVVAWSLAQQVGWQFSLVAGYLLFFLYRSGQCCTSPSLRPESRVEVLTSNSARDVPYRAILEGAPW